MSVEARKVEENDDVDDGGDASEDEIDVEDVCSDSESVGRSIKSRINCPPEKAGTEQDDCDNSVKKAKKSSSKGHASSCNSLVKPRCNCEELQSVDCHLETKELWDKFNELGTEMIITKTGR